MILSACSRNLGYWFIFSAHILTTLESSITTRSMHFKTGSLSPPIWRLVMASKAMSGVNKPTRIPWILRMAKEISLRSSFSSHDIFTISKRNLERTKCQVWNSERNEIGKAQLAIYLSWKIRLILAPPDNSLVLTNAEPEPSIVRSKSDWSCWIILSETES